MDYYKDDIGLDSVPRRSSRYSRGEERERDFYDDRRDRDRYDYDREMDYHGSYPPLSDDPLYRMPRPLLPPPRESLRDILPPKEMISDGAVVCGSVVVVPANPFEPKPKRREKPVACKTVFVGSLPDTCADKHLLDLFTNCGNIVEVRVSRGRNFGHVQFSLESSVERAMALSGCVIKIENSSSPKDRSRIHVDYAQDKMEIVLKRRIQDNEMLSFDGGNAAIVSTDLHRDDVFSYAAKNVITWFNKGACDADSSNTFFGLMNSVNSRGRKLNKDIQAKEDEDFEWKLRKKDFYKNLATECKVMVEVFDSAINGKPWNYFTKAQRKSITQWKEQTADLQERLKIKIESGEEREGDEEKEPPKKIMKLDNSSTAADLERAQREIEQLKTDREVAVEKKDKQILQLKTLLAKFKKTCPEEWEKALGVTKSEKMETEKKEEEVKKEEEEEEGGETIEGVSLEDLNSMMEKDASENSLASAAAAYAQMRKKVGSTDEVSGLGLSEAEVAMVTVLAAFLTVHPLGATIETITAYFKTFNSAYNSYFLESLLRRLTKVFQLSSGKWWFLGFQTCYATPTSNNTDGQKESP